MAGVTITIVGVGAYVPRAGEDVYHPFSRGAVIDVDQEVADRLIADGVAREGEHQVDPVLPPAPQTVEVDEPEDGPGFDLGAASDDEVAAWIQGATIPQVEQAVGQDRELAAKALAAEQDRGNDARSTLVEKLEALAS